MMELRPYQKQAVESILGEWEQGHQHTLLVLPTGTGKTVVFSKVVEKEVDKGEKALILAHRGELLDQASDKLYQTTGLTSSLEKAVTTLKELAEHGRCSVPEYDIPEEQVYQNGKYWWSCTCYIRSWSMHHTGLANSKKEAKRYAAYLVLCDYYGIPDEFKEEDDDE